MDRADLVKKFNRILDTKKCKDSQNPEPALLCRNKEKKARKDSAWKKEEVKMLQEAIAKIENNELNAYLNDMKKRYTEKVQKWKTGETGEEHAKNSRKYLELSAITLAIPSFVQFITLKMIDKENIKKYKNPQQRYEKVVQQNNISLPAMTSLPVRLNVLRLTLSHYRQKCKPTLETIL